jgi:hypothetical protein
LYYGQGNAVADIEIIRVSLRGRRYFFRIEPPPTDRPLPDDPPLREAPELLEPPELRIAPELRPPPELRAVPERPEAVDLVTADRDGDPELGVLRIRRTIPPGVPIRWRLSFETTNRSMRS